MNYDDTYDQIDATVFSGDLFHDRDERIKFFQYLGRWIRNTIKDQKIATEDCEYCNNGELIEDLNDGSGDAQGIPCHYCGADKYESEINRFKVFLRQEGIDLKEKE